MSVRMQLSRILIRELVDYQIIELREVLENGDAAAGSNGARTFPIVIGLPEAQAIERRLAGVPIKRPQTHDLLANVVEALGGEIESIEITHLEEHTFFARLNIRRAEGDTIDVDARPSDAIALGIASGVPIYVSEEVIEAAQRQDPEDL
ncbi:MAG: hypothetical protein DHS20C14_19350 [Phycisphaeraceae bacterium]|nr:MAG: hypothetical protein DHS20C14_19350 [Phycisphaeraceae bacterium]